ncbi:phage tail fiber protein [Acinetobacter lwoffii]|uniref:phage tail fiber protein n=1 Tax=Acinetobacter lwoffii TaxID=28090 RepID=UPI003F91F0CE
MAKQTINPGTAPTGAGGDTFRSGSAKLQENDDEIYNYLGDGTNLNKLGTAAFKNIGLSVGSVMEVGAFGLGLTANTPYISPTADLSNLPNGLYGLENGGHSGILVRQATGTGLTKLGIIGFPSDTTTSAPFYYRLNLANGTTLQQSQAYRHTFYTTQNTTVDSNGFIKAASPIVKLFADKVELNDEAQQQNITFEKLGIGDYLIKNSSGFAQDGWYVETPKDANSNLLVAVVYEQLENGDISVKTYDYMLNNKGRIVADTETPLDIPENRWLDIRLQELPQPEIEVTESIAPPEFQPTGLAEAVATVMESYDDPEQ